MIKSPYVILFFLFFLTACNRGNLPLQEVVTKYYKARDNADFSEIEKYISDTVTIVEGDYVMPYSQASFYEAFRWDSIFQPSYMIVDMKEKDDGVVVNVALSSMRTEFLKNSPMTCQYEISFSAGNISKIKSLDCSDVDWNVWQREVNTLVGWVKENHPQLDGFIHDMTMNGAINYLKAIELYKAR